MEKFEWRRCFFGRYFREYLSCSEIFGSINTYIYVYIYNLYIYVYIYIYVNIYIYINIYICIYLSTYIYIELPIGCLKLVSPSLVFFYIFFLEGAVLYRVYIYIHRLDISIYIEIHRFYTVYIHTHIYIYICITHAHRIQVVTPCMYDFFIFFHQEGRLPKKRDFG